MTEPRIYTAEQAVALLAAATPGPWRMQTATSGLDDHAAVKAGGYLIVEDAPDPDAALIAAAPDLAVSVAHHARRADAAEAENKRLRDLVREAYIEGWHDAPGDYWQAAPADRDPSAAWEASNAYDEVNRG